MINEDYFPTIALRFKMGVRRDCPLSPSRRQARGQIDVKIRVVYIII